MHQVGAHLGGLLGQRPAQAGADAGDDDDLALQQRDGCVAVLDRGVVGLGVSELVSTDHPSGNRALPGGDAGGVLLGVTGA